MSIRGLKDKPIAVDPYNEILFSHEKWWSTDKGYNVDKSQKHDAQWCKPDTKDHILYNYFHMNIQNWSIHRDGK